MSEAMRISEKFIRIEEFNPILAKTIGETRDTQGQTESKAEKELTKAMKDDIDHSREAKSVES